MYYILLRKQVWIITFLFHFSLVFSQEINRDSSAYKAFFYEDGKVSSEGYFVNGQPDGYWITYYPSGLKKAEGNRKNALLEGAWKFYDDNGNLKEVINYKESIKNGYSFLYKDCFLYKSSFFVDGIKQREVITYYPDSSNQIIKSIVPYIDDQKNGIAKEYSREGRLITISIYKKGFLSSVEKINRFDTKGKKIGLWKDFYKSFKLKEERRYKNDLLNGYVKYYDPEGKLDSAILYVDGIKRIEDEEMADFDLRYSYYSDGNIKSTTIYNLNGQKNGVSNEYSPEGEIIATKYYDHDILIKVGLVDKQGREQGEWIIYYSTGEVKAKGVYKDGNRNGKWIYYYPNGKIEQEGFYDKNGKYTGTWKWYYSNGQLLRQEEFRRGLEDGFLEEYDENGILITKGEFFDGEKEGEWIYELNDHKEIGKYRIGQRNGEWIYYYPNGKVAFKGAFVDGAPEGKHKYYYDNGVLEKEEYYEYGIREGKWKWYTYEGSEKLSITYKNDLEKKIDGQRVKLK